MAFWNNPELEPKRAYRFLLRVNGGGNAVRLPEFLIKKVSKPSFEISESPHNFLNHTFYYPGKVTWDTVSFTVVDVLSGGANGIDAGGAVSQLLEESGYQIPMANDPNNRSTVSKKQSVKSLGSIDIVQINSKGDEIEKWTLNNPWIKNVKFGELDYSSEDMVNVEIMIRYDNAKRT